MHLARNIRSMDLQVGSLQKCIGKIQRAVKDQTAMLDRLLLQCEVTSEL